MTTTPNLSLSKPAHGATNWDTDLNGNADILDALFDQTTGHDHDGTDGGGPLLTQAHTHQSADTDSGTSALHHTIGTSATQAAAGNHTHALDGEAVDDRVAGLLVEGPGVTLTYDDTGNSLTIGTAETFGVVFTGAGDVALRGDGSIVTKRY